MTGASKRDQGDKNNKIILDARNKRQEAGQRPSGPGTSTNTRPNTGLKRRSE
ncbi:hypothetical protein HZC31_07540 [Candidatus Woesearchaeota archaeon]|nr:hypothetical protein [Candidatus Woesearchaeota archaeon]